MQRDMDLIRALLLQIEEGSSKLPDTYPKEQILYHKRLLIEGGYAKGDTMYGGNKLQAAAITELTVKGHDFLDVVRNDAIWQKTKNEVEKVGTTSISIVYDIASIIVRNEINIIHTGGGANVAGDVNAGGNFAGRDQSEQS